MHIIINKHAKKKMEDISLAFICRQSRYAKKDTPTRKPGFKSRAILFLYRTENKLKKS